LSIRYQAMSTKDTLCNLTNHSYFNLKGEGSGKVLDCLVSIDADAFTPTDNLLIPTGEIRPVEGTWFDLRKPTPIGVCVEHMQEDEQLVSGGGFDHNFMLNGEGMRKFVECYDETTGRLVSATMQKRYGSYVSEDFTVTYEYDNLGRVVKTFCQDLLAGGQTQAIYELVYGDYYFLQPAA
jgi:galactose mutarotase-like enzyme